MKNKQKRHIWISAGHSNVVGKDRGAHANGVYEGDLTVELRNLICDNLDCMNLEYTQNKDSNALSETMSVLRNLTKNKDILIDLHFNFSTIPSATGCESYVSNIANEVELELAEKGTDTISRILGIQKRGMYKGYEGVKSETSSQHKRLGWMKLLGNNVLYEICFISNDGDFAKYQKNKRDLAYEIAVDISEFAIREVEEKQEKEMTHTVVGGDTLSKLANTYGTTVSKLKTDNNLKSDMIYVGQKLVV